MFSFGYTFIYLFILGLCCCVSFSLAAQLSGCDVWTCHCSGLSRCTAQQGHSVVSDSFATPVDHSLPGSFVHGIFQARVLEWGAIAFSTGYMPRVEISGSYAGFIPSFKGIAIPSSIVAVSIYTPTSSARVFPFLHTFSSIYCLQTF